MRDFQKPTAVVLWAVASLGLAGTAIAESGMMDGGRGPHGGMDMDAIFATLDADKDGSVTLAEVEAHHAARISQGDANADGLISADELAQMQIKAMTERAATMAADMVERLDSDADGLLSAAEMAAAAGPVKMFDRLDQDEDGAVSQAEFDAAKERMGKRAGKHGGKHGHGHGEGGFFGWFGGADKP